MTQELYSPYKLAIELGFSEVLARHYEERGTDATKLRQIARAMDLPSTKPKLGKPKPEPDKELTYQPLADYVAKEEKERAAIEPKKHKHYYRKDTGVCSCGAVRKVKA